MTLSTRARALETVVRWNTLSAGVAKLLDNPGSPARKEPGSFKDARLVDLLIRRWAKLAAEDPRNLPLDRIGETLGVDKQRQGALASAGVSDLRGLAQVLLATPAIERHAAAGDTAGGKKVKTRRATSRSSVSSPVDSKLANEIREQIAGKLLAPLDNGAES